MDLLQLRMQQFGGDFHQDFDNVIKKYTNKNFLLEQHDKMLHSQGNLPPEFLNFITTTTSEIKSSVPVPLHSRNCITLKDILKSIDTPVTGKFLLCRSICPPTKMNALFAIVDDPDGKFAVRIGLYNFVRNMSHRLPKDVYQYLPVGTVLAIMNPWFKKTADGGLTIRCDNPAEVVILTQTMVKDIIGSLPWKGEIPVKYRHKELQAGNSSFNWKVAGNDHFHQKRFHDAIQSYTNGICEEKISDKNKLDLLANRSAAYLALRKYELGLVDAESVLLVDNTHIKCLFRKAKALFGLAKYQDALNFLTSLPLDTLPSTHKNIIDELIVKAKSLIEQSQSGDYPWVHIFQNQFEELAEFVGPVIVKNTPTKGRGLFATDAIKAGQLILASKAFAHITVNRSDGFLLNMRRNQKNGRNYANGLAQTQLITEIAHILKENPEKCREVYNLYGGPQYNSHIEPIEGHGCEIDMQRIEAICFYNQFGSSSQRMMGIENAEKEHCGLWLSPSYINHSCVDGNCCWNWKKNFLFVTAFRDIAENEEILISYIPPLGQNPQEALKQFDFVCNCRLCGRDLEDNSAVRAERSDLMSRLDAIVNKYGDGRSLKVICGDITEDINKMTMILQSLNDLRKDAPELNLSYVDKMEMVASVYHRNGQFLESIRILEQMYEIIVDIPPFVLLTAKITSDIVGTYAVLGQREKIQKWIPNLKRICTLAYGTWNVMEMAFPFTYKTLQTVGISLNDI